MPRRTGAGAKRRRPNSSVRKSGAKKPFGSAQSRKWRKGMREKLACTTAGGVDARVIDRPLRSITRKCMNDYEGEEIKRQLNGFDETFALALHDEALGVRADGTFARTFKHDMARRIATEGIFLAYSCDESTFRGRQVWRVRGFSRGAIGLQATERWSANARYDEDGKPIGAHINTISRDLNKLRASGILLREGKPHSHQFDAQKLLRAGLAWCVGPPKKNPDGTPMLDKHGNPMQFALNHYYITINPFAKGTRSRCRPGKFSHPFRSPTATSKRRHRPADANTAMGRVEEAKERERKSRADKLAAMLAASDAARGIVPSRPPVEYARASAAVDPSPPPPPPPSSSAPRVTGGTFWEDPEYMARMIANSDPPDGADS